MKDEELLVPIVLIVGLWMILKPPKRLARNMLHPRWDGLSDNTRRNLLRLLGLVLVILSFVMLSLHD